MKFISNFRRANKGRSYFKVFLALGVAAPLSVIIFILVILEEFVIRANEAVTYIGCKTLDWAMTRKPETTND